MCMKTAQQAGDATLFEWRPYNDPHSSGGIYSKLLACAQPQTQPVILNWNRKTSILAGNLAGLARVRLAPTNRTALPRSGETTRPWGSATGPNSSVLRRGPPPPR